MKPGGKNSRGGKIRPPLSRTATSHGNQVQPLAGQIKSPAPAPGKQTVTRPVAPPVYRPQPKTNAQAKMARPAQSKTTPVASPIHRVQPVSVQAKMAGPVQMKTRSGVPLKQQLSVKTPRGVIQRAKVQSLQDVINEMQQISKGGGGGGGKKEEEQELCNSCLVNPPELTLACGHRLCNACVIGIAKAAQQPQQYSYGVDQGVHLVSLPYHQQVACPICRQGIDGAEVRAAQWRDFKIGKKGK